MENQWRLAFMFNALEGDLDSLEKGLRKSAGPIRAASDKTHIRFGVRDPHPDLVFNNIPTDSPHRTVDGAVEITLGAKQAPGLPAFARLIGAILAEHIKPVALEVMAGPFFPMVPVREGEVFLSLAFKRFPGTTSEQFRQWWFHQHSVLAISVLGEGLLAYDQVHLDAALTNAVAIEAGARIVAYDAYDNLTWDDRNAFLHSISDEAAMTRVFADEVGHIDDFSRRHALMRKIN